MILPTGWNRTIQTVALTGQQISDLLATGYDGGFSMEPHLGLVFHEGDGNAQSQEQRRRGLYVEYGRRFMTLMRECGWEF